MKINEFPSKINKIILERGKKLYQDGCVQYAETLLDNICFTVNVNGYLNPVYLEIDKDYNIISISCGCPYFLENHFCKHTVAVLYFYCNVLGITPKEDNKSFIITDDDGNIIGNTSNYDFHKNFSIDVKLGYIENAENETGN